jgi:hypothetical protein
MTCAIETIVLVTEVPMFAPITIGMACLKNTVKQKIKQTNNNKEVSLIPDMESLLHLSSKLTFFDNKY